MRASGGVVRDLVALVRNVGEEAYASGAASVTASHVERAADRFGRGRLLGIDVATAARLVELRPRFGNAPDLTFTPATDVDIAQRLHGILVEIAGTPTRRIVHPTIEPLVAELRRTA